MSSSPADAVLGCEERDELDVLCFEETSMVGLPGEVSSVWFCDESDALALEFLEAVAFEDVDSI
jgi:hypothetical protein